MLFCASETNLLLTESSKAQEEKEKEKEKEKGGRLLKALAFRRSKER